MVQASSFGPHKHKRGRLRYLEKRHRLRNMRHRGARLRIKQLYFYSRYAGARRETRAIEVILDNNDEAASIRHLDAKMTKDFQSYTAIIMNKDRILKINSI